MAKMQLHTNCKKSEEKKDTQKNWFLTNKRDVHIFVNCFFDSLSFSLLSCLLFLKKKCTKLIDITPFDR